MTKVTRPLSKAQRRVLAFLEADTSGDFIVVPHSVCRDLRTLDSLLDSEQIEGHWTRSSSPPGSFHMRYRVAR